MSAVIGTPMEVAFPTTVGGKPTNSYWKVLAQWASEVKSRLEKPILQSSDTTVVISGLGFVPYFVAGGSAGSVGWYDNGGYLYNSNTASYDVYTHLMLSPGDTIKSVAMNVKSGATASQDTMKMFKVSSAGVRTQIGTTKTCSGNSTNQTLSLSGLTEVVTDNYGYYLVFGHGYSSTECLYTAKYTYRKS